MKAYRVMKIWSAEKSTRWALVNDDKNYPVRIYPFQSASDAYMYAVDAEIPVYDPDWE